MEVDGNEKKELRFEFVNFIKESHRKPIFSVQFNPFDPSGKVFATAGSNRITIYSIDDDGEQFKTLQIYEDENNQELFYTCAWAYDEITGAPVIAVAGHLGIIKLINLATRQVFRTLKGHGGAVNEVKFLPGRSNFIFSVSKDYSARLWNTKTGVLVAIFGGDGGHRDEVLSLDISPFPLIVPQQKNQVQNQNQNQDSNKIQKSKYVGQIVTCGMDNTVKIWTLESPQLQQLMESSETYVNQITRKDFPTLLIPFPAFSTMGVHKNYVDCVRYFGDLILSKSTENLISLWKPEFHGRGIGHEGKVLELQELPLKECEIWYIRFCVYLEAQLVACGNQEGKIFVFDINSVVYDKYVNSISPIARPKARIPSKLQHVKCKTPIRQVTISPDGKYLIATCDDATIWRWDIFS